MARADDPQPALGTAIRELRAERGITQENLAHAAGITVGTLSLIERGKSNPAWGTVKRIVAALDSNLGQLVAKAEVLERESAQ